MPTARCVLPQPIGPSQQQSRALQRKLLHKSHRCHMSRGQRTEWPFVLKVGKLAVPVAARNPCRLQQAAALQLADALAARRLFHHPPIVFHWHHAPARTGADGAGGGFAWLPSRHTKSLKQPRPGCKSQAAAWGPNSVRKLCKTWIPRPPRSVFASSSRQSASVFPVLELLSIFFLFPAPNWINLPFPAVGRRVQRNCNPGFRGCIE